MGYLNARIGNSIDDSIKQRFNEAHVNNSGETLTTFCAQNEMKINNTYFNHKPHKITWSNTQGHSPMIDYIFSNRAVHPSQII